MKNTLIVFLRYPEIGKVKTRLIPSFGEVSTTRLYRLMVERIVSNLDSTNYSILLFASSANDTQKVNTWFKKKFEVLPQVEGDLGKRLENAFKTAFLKGAKKVIAIGTDCIDLDNIKVERAFTELDSDAATIGPTFDGGYYLIGLNSAQSAPFKDIPWSTEETYSKTCEAFEHNCIKYSVLEKLLDIDSGEDFHRLSEVVKNEFSSCFGENIRVWD